MTTADSRRLSSRTMMPRPQSSASWYSGWHRCCGVCVAPLQSRPICFGFRPRFCAIATIDASPPDQPEQRQNVLYRVLDAAIPPGLRPRDTERDECNHLERSPTSPVNPQRQLTHCFQRLANLDDGVFERLGRYESALWRQMLQTLFALQSARRR